MLKIVIILLSSLLLIGCTGKPLQVVKGDYPKIEKAKWQSNYASTLEDIFRELEERRALEKAFKTQ